MPGKEPRVRQRAISGAARPARFEAPFAMKHPAAATKLPGARGRGHKMYRARHAERAGRQGAGQ